MEAIEDAATIHPKTFRQMHERFLRECGHKNRGKLDKNRGKLDKKNGRIHKGKKEEK